MSEFLPGEQRARVCQVLLGRASLPNLWTREGPTETALGLLRQDVRTLSSRQQALFGLAWAVWETSDTTLIEASDIIRTLGKDDLRLVRSLIVAICKGDQALEAWLAKHEQLPGET